MKPSDLIIGGALVLSGPVMMDDYDVWMWDDDVFFTPRMVMLALAELGEDEVTVRLNSGGGHVWAGEQIRATLAAHPGGCRIIVEGIAASAASLLFMAGRKRLMTAGSQLMIHDPMGFADGNEEELMRAARNMGAAADLYARVYATASGKTPEDVRAIMKTETWYGPEDAIAEGFATGLVSEPDFGVGAGAGAVSAARNLTLQSARTAAFMAARQQFDQLRARKPAKADGPSGTTPLNANIETSQKENEMTTPTPSTGTAVQTTPTPSATPAPVMVAAPKPAPANTPAPVIAASETLAQERARIKGIRDMAASFVASGRVLQADVDVLIDEGVSLDQSGVRLMSVMAAQEPAGRSAAVITRDEIDTRMEGMIGALMRQTDGPAAQFRGLKVKRLAMELSGSSRGFDDAAAVRAGMRATTMMGGAYGVSDFAYITTEVMKRTLIEQYERRASPWQLVTGAAMSASDFRELHAARFGGDFSLKPVTENGEYQTAMLTDEAEGLKVERRGRTITLTFEAVINDDMGAFNRIPGEFAIAARNMESSMVWQLFIENAKLKSDGKALFHADHKNLAVTAAAISIASIGAARKAMWEQRAFGSEDKHDFLQISPDRLIVPPALETVALQFATSVSPTKDGDVNPFKSTLSPSVVANIGAAAGGSETAWYLVSSDLPPIAHAYLDGYQAPSVETLEGMNPDAVVMNARHIFGAAPVEYRGVYKNAGQ